MNGPTLEERVKFMDTLLDRLVDTGEKLEERVNQIAERYESSYHILRTIAAQVAEVVSALGTDEDRLENLEAKAEGNQSVLDALVVFHKSLNELRDRLDRSENLTDSLAGELAAQRKAASGYQRSIDYLEERTRREQDALSGLAKIVDENHDDLQKDIDALSLRCFGVTK